MSVWGQKATPCNKTLNELRNQLNSFDWNPNRLGVNGKKTTLKLQSESGNL